MAKWKMHLGYGVSVTDLFKYGNVRQAWQEYLPLTKECVASINNSSHRVLVIPPCPWVSEGKRYGYLATVYDNAVGLVLAQRSHIFPIRDHAFSQVLPRRFRQLFTPLENLIDKELNTALVGKKGVGQLDLFRGLALLTDLKALASGFQPAIPLTFQNPVRGVDDLRVILKRRYPAEFAEELQELLEATKEDLPRRKSIQYKPSFQDSWGGIEVCSTGDLLIGDLLLELKVSTRLFRGEHLWQVLAYAALNTKRKGFSIRKVGGYNPRYRHLWSIPLNELCQKLGSLSFKAFRRWFRSSLPRQMKDTGAKFIRATYSAKCC